MNPADEQILQKSIVRGKMPRRPSTNYRKPCPRWRIIGIDHIYITVSDMARSEAFYDRAMNALGFRKNTFAIDGDGHIQYFNRNFGYVLRSAKSANAHDSY